MAEDSFTHDAFQTKNDKYNKHIVHCYFNTTKTCLIVYALNYIEFENSIFFQAFAQNCFIE